MYIKGIKYVNLIEISPVVIEIWGGENTDLAVAVNNTLVLCLDIGKHALLVAGIF